MKCILVLALAVCAHAAAAVPPPPVPDYLGAYSNGENGKNKLETHFKLNDTFAFPIKANAAVLQRTVLQLGSDDLLLFLVIRKIIQHRLWVAVLQPGLFGLIHTNAAALQTGCVAAGFGRSIAALSHPQDYAARTMGVCAVAGDGKLDNEYMALKAAVTGVAGAEVFLHLPYNQAYNFALLFAELGREFPVTVQKLSKSTLALARKKTAELRELVKKLCQLGTDRGSSPDAKCNEYVDKAVKQNPKLQKQVPLFFGVGDLGYLYLKREPELVQAAKNKKVDEYLLKGKNILRALIEQDAKVIRLLFKL